MPKKKRLATPATPKPFTLKEESKRISGISILYDFPDGGKICGLYSQRDVIDLYGYKVNEELEYENVRCEYIETRERERKDMAHYLAKVPNDYLAIILSCGWDESDKIEYNYSRIEYAGNHVTFSRRFAESLYDWGKAYVFEHKVSDPNCVIYDVDYIRIKPFALNGLYAGEYLKRLDKLGEDIGRAIGEFCRDSDRVNALIR